MIQSKYNKQKRSDKNLIIALILLFVTVAMIPVIFIVRSYQKPEETPPKVELELKEGESSYLGSTIAYPRIESSSVSQIAIWKRDEGTNKIKLSFAIQRSGMDVYKNKFYFSYTDENGEIVNYEPPITTEDEYFDYESFYSKIDSTETYAAPKLTYITTALGVMYFDERIEYTEDNKAALLERYGITENSPIITMDAVNVDGKKVSYEIRIGNKLVTDAAYYFTVTEIDPETGEELPAEKQRPYIYATKTNYLDYALLNFEEFMHTTVVAAGLSQDSALEPIFTPGYEQWKNTIYKHRVDNDGNILGYYFIKNGAETETDPWYVEKDDRVVADTIRVIPYDELPDDETLEYYQRLGYIIGDDGYIRSPLEKIEYPMEMLSEQDRAEYLVASMLGLSAQGSATLTLIDGTNEYLYSGAPYYKSVNFTSPIGGVQLNEREYTYTILKVESVFENSEELLVGTDAENEAVKVTYNVRYGTYVNSVPLHAVIKLDEPNMLSDELNSKLKACDVGDFTDPSGSFTITYNKGTESEPANAIVCDVKVYIDKIIGIFNKSGKYISKATLDSYVAYEYHYEYTYSYNGTVYNEYKVEAEEPRLVYLEDASEAEKTKLLGKEMGDYGAQNLLATDKYYCQPFINFISYEVKSVESVVRSEPVVAFRYTPDLDLFYRESIYENMLEEKGVYALNAGACQSVLQIIGGTGNSANESLGLSGNKTVAVGITPDVMEKYGLYSNTIRFVLPRGLYDLDPNGELYDHDAWGWYETLEFNLYISDETESGVRYIGSDMYDIVVEIDAENFKFLDFSFVDLWARRNLALLDVDDIENMEINFLMDDMKGKYNLNFIHFSEKQYDRLEIFFQIDTNTEYTSSPFYEYLMNSDNVEAGKVAVDSKNPNLRGDYIGDFYYDYAGKDGNKESVGTSSFKEFMRIVYNISFTGTLTEEEQAKYKDSQVSMTMRFGVKGTDNKYCYEFRRIDDRRVMVTLYQIDATGNEINRGSDFCISTFAFKKIVYNFNDLLNAEDINGELATGAGNG